VLFLRLWALQILSGAHYRAVAKSNQLRHVPIEAKRGLILDANGKKLVVNVASTAVVLWPSDLPQRSGRDTVLRRLSSLVHMPVAEIEAKIKEHGNDPVTPVVLKQALHEDQIQYLLEHSTQLPGVDLTDTYLRHYNTEASLAQVLGYDGEITPLELKRMRKDGYNAGDIVGQAGVEASYDRLLRGADGYEVRQANSLRAIGLPERNRDSKDPVPGYNLRLTIDVNLQRAAERALKFGIKLARGEGHYNADGGAIVALDPRNGAVLAMASNPTYKPSVWVGRRDPKKLAPLLDPKEADKANHPLLNRAIQGLYPPGSTFKPVTALAALQEHLISPFQEIPCTPSFTVHGYTGHDQVFDNWTDAYDQPMTLPVALATSCDTYFYRVGYWFYGLPADRGHPLQAWASRFGIGAKSGIDIGPEEAGLLPTPEWRQQTFTSAIDKLWKPGDSVQLAIGQKDLLVTPLQMTRFYAMLANGGKLVTPHVVADVEMPNGDVQQSFNPPAQDTGVDPNALAIVRDGLYQATHQDYGTSVGVFGNYPIPIAGKTGSAEKVVQEPGYPAGHTEVQSWWCGFGPYDRPTIVVCALIENGGHGGSAAAPAALKVFEQYFGKQSPSAITGPSD